MARARLSFLSEDFLGKLGLKLGQNALAERALRRVLVLEPTRPDLQADLKLAPQ